jgi:ferredoxin
MTGEGSGRLRVTVDKTLCASTGNCVMIAPDVFRFDGDELVHEASPDAAHRALVGNAADVCPTQAITVTGQAGPA